VAPDGSRPSAIAAPDGSRHFAKTKTYFVTVPNWTASHLNQKLSYLRGSTNVSGKALAAGFTRLSPAASALPLTKEALSN